MPSLQVLIENGHVCRSLRAKTLAYQPLIEDEPDAAALYEEAGAKGPFWCAQTQALQGPDGRIASATHCHSTCGRDCCETA
jgi:hypothetical protein